MTLSALGQYVVQDLRPSEYTVEYDDASKVPTSISELKISSKGWPVMLLLGTSGGEYVLFDRDDGKVFFISTGDVVLESPKRTSGG